ncbi:MAG: hypothetical protein J5563_03215 [Clostridia bacterium]|nr:hypothetical protein [Clostridia bacterium]
MKDIEVIEPSIGSRTIIASEYLLLDSDVINGGGTDETMKIQTLLDKAVEWGGLHLYMDGATLVSDCLKVHSNTVIECPTADCGFFLKSGSDTSLICNADADRKIIRNRNITLQGGTYNFNSPGQNRYKGYDPNGIMELDPRFFAYEWTHGMRFFGIENLNIRDVVMLNQRTYAALFCNWKHINIENVDIPLPDNQYAQNQDGLHFFGPGEWLNIRNLSGVSGDDIIALTPDENDLVSSITDVVIDGLYLRNADQAVRLLSRRQGRLDRIVIRNVHGTYKSCGFFINPWFGEDTGNVGSIVFENIHLQPTYHKYSAYSTPFLFRIGGYIESITLKNIKSINQADSRPLIEVTNVYSRWDFNHKFVHVKNLSIDGLEVVNVKGCQEKTAYITVDSEVENLSIRNVTVTRAEKNRDVLLQLKEGARIGVLDLSHIITENIGGVVEQENGVSVEICLEDAVVVDRRKATAFTDQTD